MAGSGRLAFIYTPKIQGHQIYKKYIQLPTPNTLTYAQQNPLNVHTGHPLGYPLSRPLGPAKLGSKTRPNSEPAPPLKLPRFTLLGFCRYLSIY